MQLYIAEKPQLAKAIAAAMPGAQQYDEKAGVYRKQFNGDDVIIFPCWGHLLTLAKPEEYDEKYAKWKMEDLPIFFENWRKTVPDDDQKKKRVSILMDLIKQADSVVVAGDMDDEGQLLIDELLEFAHYKGTQLRLNTLDTSPAIMFKALNHLEDNAAHIPNGRAAAGRELSDLVFGFNLTRYYTILNNARFPLSVGRVQTPTLGLVVRRDRLIGAHNKINYYTLGVELDVEGKKVIAKYIPNKDDQHLDDGNRILDKSYLEKIASSLTGKQYTATVEKKKEKEAPPLPFNFNKLCAYCGSKWDYSPIKVMKITQNLRDNYNAITYNRSDCPFLPEEYFRQAPKTVPLAAENIKMDANLFDTSIHSRCFNDAEVSKSSHFAIIPTQTKQDISKFKPEEYNVYQAIARYYLAQFMPPATKEMTKLVILLSDGASIEAVSTEVLDKGYRALIHPESEIQTSENDEDKEPTEAVSPLSTITAGKHNAAATGTKVEEKQTKPPSHYTAATLGEDMSRISKYCTNETIKKLLLQKDNGKKGENGSIGTSATRPAIIQTLIDRGYLSEFKKGKLTYLQCTELGFAFYDALPDSIRGVDVTAKWYLIQEDIRAGKRTPDEMAKDVLKSVIKIIQSGEGRMENADKLGAGLIGKPLGKCPKCGKNIYLSQRVYRCESCGYAVWIQNALLAAIGKTLKPDIMASLLKDGKVLLNNCTSKKTGKKFNCLLKADFSGEHMQLNLANDAISEDTLGKCPKCKNGTISEYPSAFKCSNENCGFIMFKDNALLKKLGKKMTKTVVKSILQDGYAKLDGCVSAKTGSKYTCYLSLKDDFSKSYPSFDISLRRPN